MTSVLFVSQKQAIEVAYTLRLREEEIDFNSLKLGRFDSIEVKTALAINSISTEDYCDLGSKREIPWAQNREYIGNNPKAFFQCGVCYGMYITHGMWVDMLQPMKNIVDDIRFMLDAAPLSLNLKKRKTAVRVVVTKFVAHNFDLMEGLKKDCDYRMRSLKNLIQEFKNIAGILDCLENKGIDAQTVKMFFGCYRMVESINDSLEGEFKNDIAFFAEIFAKNFIGKWESRQKFVLESGFFPDYQKQYELIEGTEWEDVIDWGTITRKAKGINFQKLQYVEHPSNSQVWVFRREFLASAIVDAAKQQKIG
jgi:hypothetical protein